MATDAKSDEVRIPGAEGVLVEFKQAWTETVKETFCAFANTSGGTVYIGVADDGKIVGVEKPDEVMRSVLSVFRFAMSPKADELCRAECLTVGGKSVVVVHVLEGNMPPYYVTMKTDHGRRKICFLRHGSSNYETTDDEERRLYQKANPVSYELRPARNQDLTFKTAAKYFEAAGIPFGEKAYQPLGMKTLKGFFTNLAWWLSDQNESVTRVGFFNGPDKASPVDGIYTFKGCLIEQYDAVRRMLNNRFGFAHEMAPFDLQRDGSRNEVREYPENAVREALVNMFALRDYSVENGQAFVSCFSDHMEMLSYGGLPPETTIEMLKEGASLPRNLHLAELLMRLWAMEKFGLGIPLMYSSYKPFGMEPTFVSEPRMLKILLPKVTLHYGTLTEREKAVVEYMRANGAVTRPMIQAYLGRSYTTAINVLKSLEAKQAVVREGGGKETRYRLK